MSTIRLFFLLLVVGTFNVASNAQTKVVEVGNMGVSIPESWDSYEINDFTSMGMHGFLVKDENAEQIYMLFEMESCQSPEETMQYGVMNNNILKENVKWGEIESIKFHSFDACKVRFTNTFAHAPRTGTAITFSDTGHDYTIMAMAVPGYDFTNDPVISSFRLTGKASTSESSSASTREQLELLIDMFKNQRDREIGNGITYEEMSLHPTKDILTLKLRITYLNKSYIDEETLAEMNTDFRGIMIEMVDNMTNALSVFQHCKDENYTFVIKMLDKNKQELCSYTLTPEEYNK